MGIRLGTDDAQDPLEGSDTIRLVEWWRDFQYQELHLLILGFYAGFVAVIPRRSEVPEGPGLGGGDWYHRGGYVLGYLAKVLILLAIGPDLPAVAIETSTTVGNLLAN